MSKLNSDVILVWGAVWFTLGNKFKVSAITRQKRQLKNLLSVPRQLQNSETGNPASLTTPRSSTFEIIPKASSTSSLSLLTSIRTTVTTPSPIEGFTSTATTQSWPSSTFAFFGDSTRPDHFKENDTTVNVEKGNYFNVSNLHEMKTRSTFLQYIKSKTC